MLVGSRGTYELADEIASGGTATVYLARLTGPGGATRVVAVKQLHPHLSRDASFRAMISDEARLAARIQHPNVCSVLDVISEEDNVALVLEYVAGASIAAIADRYQGPFPSAIAVSIARGVLAGLGAAHGATDDDGSPLALVHRDVSPQNVLVGVDGVARLTDFGTAKALGRITETADGIVKGKVAYMPPEQIRGDPVGVRADLYSIAVVLWEMLAGRRLFEGNGPATMLDVLEQPVPSLTSLGVDVTPELDAVVLRGLSKDASARFSSTSEMALALGDACRPAMPRTVGEWVRPLVDPARATASSTWPATRLASHPSRPGRAATPEGGSRRAPSAPARASAPPSRASAPPSRASASAPAPRKPSASRPATLGARDGRDPGSSDSRDSRGSRESTRERTTASQVRLSSARMRVSDPPAAVRGVDNPLLEPIEEIVCDVNGAAVMYGRLLVQVRAGEITVDALERIDRSCRLGLLRLDGELAAVAVLEVGATIAGRELRKRQWETISRLMSSPRNPYMAVVTMGRDLGSALLRSASRLYARGNPRMHFTASIDDAAARVGAHMGVPARVIAAAVEDTRERVRRARLSARAP